jgi:YVTN family beta-propeller protein
VWVSDKGNNTVMRIDPAINQFIATISVEDGPTDMAADL